MSTLIGGFFSTLDIVTNAGSFHKAQAAIFSITEESQRASEAFETLQEKMKKSWGPGAFSGGGGRGLPPGKAPLALPAPEQPGASEQKEEEKRSKKKDYLARLAALYAVYKLMKMMADMLTALAKLTYAMTQGNMKAFVSALSANMSASAIREWTMAAKINGQSSEDLISAFNSFNKAFAELKIGEGEAFGQYAKDISILSKASGVDLDPAKMIGMTNDERINAIFYAAKKLAASDMQTAIRLLTNLLGEGATNIMLGDLKGGGDSLTKARGSIMTKLNADDIAVAQDIGLFFESVKEALNYLGQTLGRTFHDKIKKFNEWFKANKDAIAASLDAFAKGLEMIFETIGKVIDFFRAVDSKAQQINRFLDYYLPFMNLLSKEERERNGGTAWDAPATYPMSSSGYPGGVAEAYADTGRYPGQPIIININGSITRETIGDFVNGVQQSLQRSSVRPVR